MTPVRAIAGGLAAGTIGTMAMDALLFARYRRGGGEDSFRVWEFSSDVSSWEEMSGFAVTAHGRTGRIDAIFNNAGINAYTNIMDATVGEFDRIMAVNARGVFIGMKAALPYMVHAGRGAIVNTASNAAKMAIADRASYTASKGAVVAMTRQVAVQYAAAGVRANCINPGSTNLSLRSMSRAPKST